MLVLAGAGEPSILYYLEKIKNGTEIDFIVDNDPMIQGEQFFEHIICSPEILTKMPEKANINVIITTVIGYDKFETQLLNAGIPKENIQKLNPRTARLKRNPKITINDISDVILSLNKKGVSCLPAYGTLLGLIRDSKILPYDDDVDTWILENTLNGLSDKVLKKIQKEIFPNAGHMRIRKHYLPENKFCGFRDPAKLAVTFYFPDKTHLRIDFFLLCKSGSYYYATHNQEDLYRLPVELFKSTSYYNAAGKEHLVPSNHNGILEAIYGEWRVPVKPNEDDGQYYDHLHKLTI